jgi:DNA-binding NarL/FixJ family response regulator
VSDTISDDMRQAIDAFPDADVLFIARGVSGIETGASGREWYFNRTGLAPGLRKRSANRRAEYIRAVASGMDFNQIAAALGVKRKTVYQTLSRMKLKLRPKGLAT